LFVLSSLGIVSKAFGWGMTATDEIDEIEKENGKFGVDTL